MNKSHPTKIISISTKWMIATLIIVIIFSIILVSFFIKQGSKSLISEQQRWCTSLANSLADKVSYHILVKDYETLQSNLFGVMIENEILYSAILDSFSWPKGLKQDA